MDPKKRNYQWTLGHVWVCSRTAYRVCYRCRFHPATQADGILPGDSRYLRLRAKHVLSDCIADIFAVLNWVLIITCWFKNSLRPVEKMLVATKLLVGLVWDDHHASWAASVNCLTMSSTIMYCWAIYLRESLCLSFTCSVQCVGVFCWRWHHFCDLVDTKLRGLTTNPLAV